MSLINTLTEKREAILADASALVEAAAAETRDLTEDEATKVKAATAEADVLEARIAEVRALADREARSESIRKSVPNVIIRDEATAGLTDEVRSFINGEIRDLTIATAADGAGNAAIPEMVSAFISARDGQSGIYPLTQKLVTAQTGPVYLPREKTKGANAAITADAATPAEDDPTFDVVTLGVHRYAKMVELGALMSAANPGIGTFAARNLGQAIGRAVGAAVATGNGTTAPEGLFTNAAAGVGGAAAAHTYDRLVDLVYSVPTEYHADSVFVMSAAEWAELRKLKDGQNRPLLGDVNGGTGPSLLGFRVVVDSYVPAKTIGFGWVGSLVVREAGTVRLVRAEDPRNGNTILRAEQWLDAKSTEAGVFKKIARP